MCIGVLGTGAVAVADVISETVNPTFVLGTDTAAGIATVDGNPFQRERTVTLTSSLPTVASVPASVVTSFRSNSAPFTVTTFPVAAPITVTLWASEGNSTRQTILTVYPPQLTAVSFNPNPLRGGDNATATITINRPAPAN
jgi:hypothetical protein